MHVSLRYPFRDFFLNREQRTHYALSDGEGVRKRKGFEGSSSYYLPEWMECYFDGVVAFEGGSRVESSSHF